MARWEMRAARQKSRRRFRRDGLCPIDHKDTTILLKVCTSHGKVHSHTRSGNCAPCHPITRTAIKRARCLAPMPCVDA